MDAYEAMEVVRSRISDLDTENASKILGHIMLQGQGEKEVIRLAFAPESILRSSINQAKSFMGILTSNSPEPSTPFSNNALQRTSPNALHFNNTSFPRKGSRPISYAEVVNGSNVKESDFSEEFLGGVLDAHSPVFIPDPFASKSVRNDSLVFPYSDDLNTTFSLLPQSLQRNNSVTAATYFPSNLGLGCIHFSSGECKNCDSCRFSNNQNTNGAGFEMGSPGIASSGFDEFLRQQQQRSAFMASRALHHVPYNHTNFHNENPRFDSLSIGLRPRTVSSSQQIYLTFPPDSLFKEDDVTSYFSAFGVVQGVRIPYQPKRMFGFVTFVSSESVKSILSKGNPHFILDARVLVKPYKEKGKFLEKKSLHRQIEQLDIPFGPRMLNTRRRYEEQGGIRNGIECESQRMMNMHNINYDSYSPSSASPIWSEFLMRLNSIPLSESINFESSRDSDDGRALPGAAIGEDHRKQC